MRKRETISGAVIIGFLASGGTPFVSLVFALAPPLLWFLRAVGEDISSVASSSFSREDSPVFVLVLMEWCNRAMRARKNGRHSFEDNFSEADSVLAVPRSSSEAKRDNGSVKCRRYSSYGNEGW